MNMTKKNLMATNFYDQTGTGSVFSGKKNQARTRIFFLPNLTKYPDLQLCFTERGVQRKLLLNVIRYSIFTQSKIK